MNFTLLYLKLFIYFNSPKRFVDFGTAFSRICENWLLLFWDFYCHSTYSEGGKPTSVRLQSVIYFGRLQYFFTEFKSMEIMSTVG